ncbi:MAG TPA: protein kinase [Gemmatimonadaceae bacterium]|nr:protein kinase [Gemmatimonadaceae bacterium]
MQLTARDDITVPLLAKPAELWDEGDNRPETDAAVRMHPLTLRFDGAREAEFIAEYFERTLVQVRLAFLLALGLYTAFGVLDTFTAPVERNKLWFIRYVVIAPILLGAIVFTYKPQFLRIRDETTSMVTLIAALGIVVMTALIPPPGSYLYYAGLLLAIMFAFTLVRLTLPYATAVSAITVGAYLAVAIGINHTPSAVVVNNLFFLGSTFIIGFSSNYSMERYARSNFLQRRLIARRTEELERKNEELVAKNRMLAEQRAATIRSAKRTDLIFSALSERLPGTVLDEKYRVREKIGSGGFGTVYRGEHIFLHHPVAIKVFRPAIGRDALESLDRFRVEGISACRINHPNAVTVLDFDVSAGSLAYLVMELLHGHSLLDEMKNKGKLDPLRALRIGHAVCAALAEAHGLGIVHRDIKPSNVFLHTVRGEERIKVIDFGIAKLTDKSETPELQNETTAGTFLGTPAYMAPERLFNQSYDGRADVFALGVMIFEMIAGRLPFESKGPLQAIRMQMLKQPAHLSEFAPNISAEVEQAVNRAMAKEPEQRPTAREFALTLRGLLDAGSVAASRA